MFDCSLRSRGSRCEAAAFLSHSQTKSVSARSCVQDSGARFRALGIRRLRRRSHRIARRRAAKERATRFSSASDDKGGLPGAIRGREQSDRGNRLRSLLLRTSGTRFPTLAAEASNCSKLIVPQCVVSESGCAG
jgi:hypothetical protein